MTLLVQAEVFMRDGNIVATLKVFGLVAEGCAEYRQRVACFAQKGFAGTLAVIEHGQFRMIGNWPG